MSVVIKGDSNVNLDFSTGGRITGDFSNATLANRVYAQNTTANAGTSFGVLPNGTGANSAYNAFASSDPTNTSFAQLRAGADTADVRLTSGISGTGTYLPMTFFTGGSERVRIDTSGNVGVGTSSPATKFNVYTGSATNTLLRINNTAGTVDYGVLSTGEAYGGFATSTVYYGTSGASPAIFYTNNVERLRITSAGDVGIGTSSPGYKLEVASTNSIVASRGTGGYGSFYAVGSGTNASYLFLGNAGGEKGRITSIDDGTLTFSNGTSSTERARITAGGEVYIAGTTDQGAYNLQVNGTGVWGAGAYVNGSDERLKDNIQTLNDGLSVVNQLRPVTFQYKPEHSKDQSVQPGFIAQELQQAMAGKDYVDGVVQSGPEYLNVAYQNLIPILTKAIQEQQAIIESLTARITALEAK